MIHICPKYINDLNVCNNFALKLTMDGMKVMDLFGCDLI